MSGAIAWLLGVLPVATFLAGYAIGHKQGNKRAWRDAQGIYRPALRRAIHRARLLKEDT